MGITLAIAKVKKSALKAGKATPARKVRYLDYFPFINLNSYTKLIVMQYITLKI